MRILVLLTALVVGLGLMGCGDCPKCDPIAEAEVTSGARGYIEVMGFLWYKDSNEELQEMHIKAPFKMEASGGRCFKGETRKRLTLLPGFYSFEPLDITDEKELNRIRDETGLVGDFITPYPDDDDPRLTDDFEAEIENGKERSPMKFYYSQ